MDCRLRRAPDAPATQNGDTFSATVWHFSGIGLVTELIDLKQLCDYATIA